METTISQADDWLGVKIDGQEILIDVGAAHDALIKIDRKHDRDPWHCTKPPCEFEGGAKPEDMKEPRCPVCGQDGYRRDPVWLDSVAAYVLSIAPQIERCSRNAAAQIYTHIVGHIEAIKKNAEAMPESPISLE